MKITTKTARWLRRRALDLGVSVAVLAWILACAKKKAAPPPKPATVAASMGNVTYRQLDDPGAGVSPSVPAGESRPAATPAADRAALSAVLKAYKAKNYSAAAKLARAVLEAGPPDAVTKATVLDFAIASSFNAGDFDGALSLSWQIEEAMESDVPWQKKASLLHWVRAAQAAKEDHAAATETAKRRHQILVDQEGAAAESTIEARRTIAVHMREAGDTKAARKEFEKTIEAAEANLGKAHRTTVMARIGLGATLLKSKKYSAAADELGRARNVLPRMEEKLHPVSEANLYLLLGEAQVGLKKKDLAADSLETSIALYKKARTTEETTAGQAQIEKELTRAEAALARAR